MLPSSFCRLGFLTDISFVAERGCSSFNNIWPSKWQRRDKKAASCLLFEGSLMILNHLYLRYALFQCLIFFNRLYLKKYMKLYIHNFVYHAKTLIKEFVYTICWLALCMPCALPCWCGGTWCHGAVCCMQLLCTNSLFLLIFSLMLQ